jgi:uncharacterized OsmC-like protein
VEWEISVSLSGDGLLKLEPSPVTGTPVDMLAAAIASCFAKSCHMVLGALSHEPCRVDVVVRASKSRTPPNRVDRVEIVWAMQAIADDLAARVAKDAKRICTVTNSMSCEFEVYPK